MSDEAPTHKQCTKCGEMKLLHEFFNAKKGKYGKRGDCKVCSTANYDERRSYFADYYVANKKRIREVQRIYERINYPTISKAKRPYRLAYYVANKKRINDRNNAHNASQYAADPDKVRAINRARYAANPDCYRAAKQRRRARIKGNGGTFTVTELKAMRIEYAGVCFYCKGQHEPDELTIDHVIPIRQGGRHEAANIVLACGICNNSKNNRRPDQWKNRWYERKNRPKKK